MERPVYIEMDEYNSQINLYSLFESGPAREQDDKATSEKSEEENPVGNQFNENVSRNEEGLNGFLWKEMKEILH